MLHMKEDTYAPVDAPAGATAVDVSPRDFEDGDAARAGLSPRRDRKPAQRGSHQPHHKLLPGAPEIDLNPYHEEEEDAFGDEGDLFDSEGKPRALQRDGGATSGDGLTDARFRVNGIAVGREVQGGPKPGWEHSYQILFQNSTPTGQRVALILLIMVSLSIACAVLDSIFFTVVFSVEYALRVACLLQPRKFMLSMLGVVDICALVPSYLGMFVPAARPLLHLAVLRIFRVMRVFRILRLARFVDASAALSDNIQSNKRRILVFLVGLFTLILVIGCAMYLIEGDRNDFSNIPISLYWAVVTITTVGYGDISPQTILGRMLATVVMFVGYGIIACPLVLSQSGSLDALADTTECPRCFRRMHQDDANFCRVCGTALREPRAKTVKARLRLEKLASPHARPTSLASTTSTSKSNARLLADDLDDPAGAVHA
ncbi:hypothetical protein PybrP1_000248 [[Pythium] brassicae (nom. inval.)]|nr:hypothetical protein PybrP1_000248 [[Pythium] brassicae (nom. inval.)]